MAVDDLVRRGSKAELLECAAEYWNSDRTAFSIGVGIGVAIDRRDGLDPDTRAPGQPRNDTLTTPHRSWY
jgi:hypothetical protein